MNFLRLLALTLFLALIHTCAAEESQKRLDQVVDAPFGKAYVSVLQRQDGERMLFYVAISKSNDTPSILAEDVSAVVLDQNGTSITCKPLSPERGSLSESRSFGTTASKQYQLTLANGQKPTGATVTWLGHKLEFKTIQMWRFKVPSATLSAAESVVVPCRT